MANRAKLLEKAKNSPNNLRFDDLCNLAEAYGWQFKKQDGTSHRLGFNAALTPEQGRRMNFQNYNGKAKPNQVRQLVAAIENLSDE